MYTVAKFMTMRTLIKVFPRFTKSLKSVKHICTCVVYFKLRQRNFKLVLEQSKRKLELPKRLQDESSCIIW